MNPYDYTPRTGSTRFLKLENKGDTINIRIVGAPVREYKVWRDGESKPVEDEKIARLSEEQIDQLRKEIDTATGKKKYRVAEQFTWVVLDRDDTSISKSYTGPVSVFNKIKALAQNPKWGDPGNYDLTITRTEQPGNNYYEVMPDPQKSELTADELEAATEIDLAGLRPFAKALGTAQPPMAVTAAPVQTQVPVSTTDPLAGGSLADEL